MELRELNACLRQAGADFALIKQDAPILTRADGAKYFPPEQAVAVLIARTEQGLAAFYVSADHGRLDFAALKTRLGFQKLKLADRKAVAAETGYEPGSVPLVGLGLPGFLERNLLRYDYVYGGTGNPLCTLKIAPKDLERLNQIQGYF